MGASRIAQMAYADYPKKDDNRTFGINNFPNYKSI